MNFAFERFFSGQPAILAPMEEVSDAAFRAVCRARGADLAVTEFVHADALLEETREAARKITLAEDDTPTAIQIYGANPESLARAAMIAEQAGPAFIDVNCGCWVPKVARGGAGAGWLKDPEAMVSMAARIAKSVSLPVTLKTRLGWGDEAKLPIVDLAKRLEDVGVAAITVHCRTALMGHEGSADWSWAKKVAEAVRIPVILNGDVRSADDAHRALAKTGCAAVMIGRRAIEHPWIFREVRARLDDAPPCPPPTEHERLSAVREHLIAMRALRRGNGPLRSIKRYLPGYLKGVVDARTLARQITESPSVEVALAVIDQAAEDASVVMARG